VTGMVTNIQSDLYRIWKLFVDPQEQTKVYKTRIGSNCHFQRRLERKSKYRHSIAQVYMPDKRTAMPLRMDHIINTRKLEHYLERRFNESEQSRQQWRKMLSFNEILKSQCGHQIKRQIFLDKKSRRAGRSIPYLVEMTTTLTQVTNET
jgi:hypothetical protein